MTQDARKMALDGIRITLEAMIEKLIERERVTGLGREYRQGKLNGVLEGLEMAGAITHEEANDLYDQVYEMI